MFRIFLLWTSLAFGAYVHSWNYLLLPTCYLLPTRITNPDPNNNMENLPFPIWSTSKDSQTFMSTPQEAKRVKKKKTGGSQLLASALWIPPVPLMVCSHTHAYPLSPPS